MQRILENPAAASHHWRKKLCTRVPRLTISTKGREIRSRRSLERWQDTTQSVMTQLDTQSLVILRVFDDFYYLHIFLSWHGKF